MVILTVLRQLHQQLFIMALSSVELVLNASLIVVSKHLGVVAVQYELLIASLQTLDKLTVFIRPHFGQLNINANKPALSLTCNQNQHQEPKST